MGLLYNINRFVTGIVSAVDRLTGMGVYSEDGLITAHCHDFIREPDFSRAYGRGVQASRVDPHMRWRVHGALWAACSAGRLNGGRGDFVECGVNRGFVSSAIMERMNWNTQNRTFYLLDTFSGLDPLYMSEVDVKANTLKKNAKKLRSGEYVSGVESVSRNFSEWKNVKIIVGSIPSTLPLVESNSIAYLHLDMNCAPPEVAAFEFFWPRLLPGAFVLLDDYAYRGFGVQKAAMDAAAADHGALILSLPTGQGLLLKPA